MKKLIINTIITLILVVSSSCKSYQLITIESKLPKSENREFLIENDALKITYSFKGPHCPVNIQVFNKLDKPIYVDWSKSAIILNDLRVPLWEDKASIKASSVGTSYNVSNQISSTYSDINGVAYKLERVSFIPPKSFIARDNDKTVYLYHSFLPLPDKKNASDVNVVTATGPSQVVKYKLSEDSSKYVFRSYLTLSIKEDFLNPMVYENKFWISEIIKTEIKPEDITYKPANRFYIQKTTGFGTFMGCTLGIGALAGLLALSGGGQ